MTQAVTTLYELLGGAPAIEAVVGEFYERVLADVELKGYFAKTDMDRQMQQQIKFITMALGGPDNYDGKSMADAHVNMGITEHHFDLVAGHLVGALTWANVSRNLIDDVVAVVAPLKGDVVTV